jgi:hypothetical protein
LGTANREIIEQKVMSRDSSIGWTILNKVDVISSNSSPPHLVQTLKKKKKKKKRKRKKRERRK